jgi:hypothetical protein
MKIFGAILDKTGDSTPKRKTSTTSAAISNF